MKPSTVKLLAIVSRTSKKRKRKGEGNADKETRLRIDGQLPAEYRGPWIHLPTLTRVRLKPIHTLPTSSSNGGRGELGTADVRIKGIPSEALASGDEFLPLESPQVAAAHFYGTFSGSVEKRRKHTKHKGQKKYRIRPAFEMGQDIFRLDARKPLSLLLGEPFELEGGLFTPLCMYPFRYPAAMIDSSTSPFEAQGWLPAAAVPGVVEGPFCFHPDYPGSKAELLRKESRLEGGFALRRLAELVHIPPYLMPELTALLLEKEGFRLHRGVLLDGGWDYASSLSPFSAGILSELRDEGLLIEKIATTPRYRGLRLLVQTALAAEIEEGVFVEEQFLRRVYRLTTELRATAPATSLAELAAGTGVRKRYLIPLLQYGDAELGNEL